MPPRLRTFDYLPKLDAPGAGYDVLHALEMMNQGKMNGYICQGFNPVGSFPNKKKIIAGLSKLKLKFLITIDPVNTETSEFWQNYGEHNDIKPQDIQTWLQRVVVSIHALSALVISLTTVVHIHAAIWVKGTLHAMTQGTVSAGWTKHHHLLWYQDKMQGCAAPTTGESSKA